MGESEALERAYRRWLRCYPRWFRLEHGEEMLGVLLAGSPPESCALGPMDRLDLALGGLGVRLRPRVPRSDRAARLAIRLMLLGAVVEAALAILIWATAGEIRNNIAARDPHYSTGQWHGEMTGRLEPLAIGAAVFVAVWLWMAWANGRGRLWAKLAFGLVLISTTLSLLQGLSQGSATYAPQDLLAGLVLWGVELGAVIALACSEIRRISAARAAAARTGSPSTVHTEDAA